MKKAILRVCLLMAILAIQSVWIQAQANAFTYQGSIKTGGTAVSGLYDFQFDICDAPTGGNVLATQSRIGVSVTNGIFTVNLTASPTVFSGAVRYLEIRVKPSSGTVFDTLEPRQLITSAPYALKSFNATNADFSTNSQNALNATNATNAANSVNAQFATSAGFASSANSANSANTADTATTALNSNNLGGIAANQYYRFKWNVVETDLVALPNQGYIAVDPESQVNLPTTAQIGDVLRVTTYGVGSFVIGQAAGQQIVRSGDNDTSVWTPRDTNRNWESVASSADGTKLVACSNSPGYIYTSTDSGATWTQRGLTFEFTWSDVASSDDGTKLVAASRNGGPIYTSTDSGITWTPRTITSRLWASIASSADGTILVAAGSLNGVLEILTSTNSGTAWTLRTNLPGTADLAISADGSKMAAAVDGGQIYTSTDFGVTWTPRTTNRPWRSIASSADGTKLFATAGGLLYASEDSGVNWTVRNATTGVSSIKSSKDGTRLISGFFGQIYTSSDSGLTFTSHNVAGNWKDFATSADGSKLVAVALGGQIYTHVNTRSALGTTGMLIGGAASSVELVYMGGGRFLIVGSTGNATLR